MTTPSLLIVDDEEAVRFMLNSLLSLEGWDVTEVETGEAALEVCATREFDAIVLDYRMPGLYGIEVARELRRRGSRAHILLYSGYLSPEVEQEAKELQVRFVGKGDVPELLELLKKLPVKPE